MTQRLNNSIYWFNLSIQRFNHRIKLFNLIGFNNPMLELNYSILYRIPWFNLRIQNQNPLIYVYSPVFLLQTNLSKTSPKEQKYLEGVPFCRTKFTAVSKVCEDGSLSAWNEGNHLSSGGILV
jgi:hypothetical protein